MDCLTCEYANRDNYGRYIERCSGFGNCGYEPYTGKVLDVISIDIKREHLDLIYDILIRTDCREFCGEETMDEIVEKIRFELKGITE